jgi:hypothetical protein
MQLKFPYPRRARFAPMKGLIFTLTFTRLWRATPLPSREREMPNKARAHYTYKNTVSLFSAPVNSDEDTLSVHRSRLSVKAGSIVWSIERHANSSNPGSRLAPRSRGLGRDDEPRHRRQGRGGNMFCTGEGVNTLLFYGPGPFRASCPFP